MTKVKNNILFSLISIILSIGVSVAVLHTEFEKRNYKILALKNSYEEQYKEVENYRNQYNSQVISLKAENSLKMKEAKIEYDKLLAQQPDLIRLNTAVVSTVSTSSENSNKVTVSKPRSGPVTSAS